MNKGQKAQNFFERFDCIIWENELSDKPIKLNDEKIRLAFYSAIIGAFPEIRFTQSTVSNLSKNKIDMNDKEAVSATPEVTEFMTAHWKL